MQYIVFLFGLLVGSFLNVLADRLPFGESVLWGRSHCDFCRKPLRWFELIPIVSFLFQGGRCLRCKKKLSFQYPVVELITALGFVYFTGQWAYMIIFCAFVVIFVSDLKYQIIPDSMVVVIALSTLAAIGLQADHLYASCGAGLFFYAIWRLTKGRGMGFGDVKLAFALGLFLGFPDIIVALYMAFLTGAIVGVILILIGQKRPKSKIAFGPFLVAGAVGALVWGQSIVQWWKGII